MHISIHVFTNCHDLIINITCTYNMYYYLTAAAAQNFLLGMWHNYINFVFFFVCVCLKSCSDQYMCSGYSMSFYLFLFLCWDVFCGHVTGCLTWKLISLSAGDLSQVYNIISIFGAPVVSEWGQRGEKCCSYISCSGEVGCRMLIKSEVNFSEGVCVYI